MKVHLKFPWRFIDSPYYRNLINYPPEGVNFTGVSKEDTILITSPKIFRVRNAMKKILRVFVEGIKLPNVTFTHSNADLVHCARCLLLNKLPWVVDVEHYWNFSLSDKISYSKIGRSLIEKLLKKEYCKKILPWTHATESTIRKVIKNEQILDKLEVVYPAVPVPKLKRKKSEKTTLLFIGRYFYPKGGLFALETFKRLKQKYDIRCILISLTIPNEIKAKYENFTNIYKSVSEDYLFREIYPVSDILVYPGFSDTFGFALLEAMSFGIPIITVDAFARKEIVENGKNGFVIEKPKSFNVYRIDRKEEKLVEEMAKLTSLLIEDSSLRKRMGRYGRKLVEKGKFSIKERNKKLRRIYEEALR